MRQRWNYENFKEDNYKSMPEDWIEPWKHRREVHRGSGALIVVVVLICRPLSFGGDVSPIPTDSF
jgi:hypothetical protein